jgi:1-acyl-sn-glycerol-3-phosphate acyltransferase
MPGRSRRQGSPRKRPRARRAREAGPVLGNDPFVRGAAPRAAAGPAAGAPPPAPEPSPGPPAAPVASPRAEGDAADGLSAELREAVERLLPRLRAGLAGIEGGLAGLLQLLRHPAGGNLDPFGRDAALAARLSPLGELLHARWWRTDVREPGHVPSSGPAIVFANHAGVIPWDALVLALALSRDHPAHRALRPLLDERECALPALGRLALRLGAVRASPPAAETLLGQGQVVGVFPEGSAGARKPWRDRYRLQGFGRGFVKLALRTGAPLVPCAIVGSEEASPALSRAGWLADHLGLSLLGAGAGLRLGPAALVPLPARFSLRFGPPIPADDPAAAAGDPAAVSALAERARGALESMLAEDLAARRSVYL